MTASDIADTDTQNQSSEQPQQQEDAQPSALINVGSQERLISAGAGALLALYGLKRMRLGSILIAAGGVMLLKRALTGHCNLYAALGKNTATGDGAAPEEYFNRGIQVAETFTISNKSAEELYAFWRNFTNLPQFMKHLEEVRCEGDRSHWVANGPAGYKVEWDAEIINDVPNRIIAWRSLGGADVDNAGAVRFTPAPGGRGTEVAVTMDYIPPAGRAGAFVAKLLGRDADQMIREDLRRFKQLMETGEIPTTEGQPSGSCGA